MISVLHRRSLSLLVALALLLVACGGGGDDDSDLVAADGSAAPDSSASAVDDAGPAASPTSVATPTTSPATEPAEGADTDFCRAANELEGATDASALFNATDPAELEASYRGILADIESIAPFAPEEIRGDVEISLGAFRDLVSLLGEIEFDVGRLLELEDDPRLVAFEDPELVAASSRIEAFCGFDADLSGATDPESDESTPDGDDGNAPDLDPEVTRSLMIDSLQAAFGIDAELATCLIDELGLDDPTSIDPSVFGDADAEVCGITISELFG